MLTITCDTTRTIAAKVEEVVNGQPGTIEVRLDHGKGDGCLLDIGYRDFLVTTETDWVHGDHMTVIQLSRHWTSHVVEGNSVYPLILGTLMEIR